MSAAYFYIEYRDGRFTQINFKTPGLARQAYNFYENLKTRPRDGVGRPSTSLLR